MRKYRPNKAENVSQGFSSPLSIVRYAVLFCFDYFIFFRRSLLLQLSSNLINIHPMNLRFPLEKKPVKLFFFLSENINKNQPQKKNEEIVYNWAMRAQLHNSHKSRHNSFAKTRFSLPVCQNAIVNANDK